MKHAACCCWNACTAASLGETATGEYNISQTRLAVRLNIPIHARRSVVLPGRHVVDVG